MKRLLRLLRFRLRTLLLAFVLISGLLCFLSWQVRRAQLAKHTDTRIREVGANIWQYEPNRLGRLNRALPTPVADRARQLFGHHFFSEISRVSISSSSLTNQELTELIGLFKQCSSLREISLLPYSLTADQRRRIATELPTVEVSTPLGLQ
jgi:hypothetical protein